MYSIKRSIKLISYTIVGIYIFSFKILLPQPIITEIYYKTLGSSFHNQWIEIYNTSENNISISEIFLINEEKTNLIQIADDSFLNQIGKNNYSTEIIPSQSYFLIFDPSYQGEESFEVEDTLIFISDSSSLGKSSFLQANEKITLRFQTIDDSVLLIPSANGYSLQRKNNLILIENNWGIDRYSPGKINTILEKVDYNQLVDHFLFQALSFDKIYAGVPYFTQVITQTPLSKKLSFNYNDTISILFDNNIRIISKDSSFLEEQISDNHFNMRFIAGESISFVSVLNNIGSHQIIYNQNKIQTINPLPLITQKQVVITEILTKNYKWIEINKKKNINNIQIHSWNESLTSYNQSEIDIENQNSDYIFIIPSGEEIDHRLLNSFTTIRLKHFDFFSSGWIILYDNEVLLDAIFYRSSDYETIPNQSLERKNIGQQGIGKDWILSDHIAMITPGKLFSTFTENSQIETKLSHKTYSLNRREDLLLDVNVSEPGELIIEIYTQRGIPINKTNHTFSSLPFIHQFNLKNTFLKNIQIGNYIIKINFYSSINNKKNINKKEVLYIIN